MEKIYFADIREKEKKMTPEEEAPLFLKAQSGCTQSRDILFFNHARFAIFEANKRMLPQYEDELIQAANIGLLRAIELFDPTRGVKFISFAVWYIKSEMNKWMDSNYRTIRLPTNIAQKIYSGKKDLEDYTTCLSSELMEPEVVENIHYKNCYEEQTEDKKEKINQLLEFLPPKYKEVVKLRIFNQDITWNEIGAKYNNTGANVRDTFFKAMVKIRKKYTKEEIIKYFFE